MAKKDSLETKKEVTDHSPIHTNVCAFSLKIGPWKNLFGDEQNKIIIARALNQFWHHDKSIIAGYIITGTGLCLVLYCKWDDIKDKLDLLDEWVRQGIEQHLEWLKKRERRNYKAEEHTDSLLKPLFIRYPLYNYDLVKPADRPRD